MPGGVLSVLQIIGPLTYWNELPFPTKAELTTADNLVSVNVKADIKLQLYILNTK